MGGRFPTASQANPLKKHPYLTMAAEALPALLKDAQDRSMSGVSPEVLLIVARWFQIEREGLLAWLEETGRPQPLQTIVSRWLAKHAPDAAWESIAQNRDKWDRDLINALLLEDPAKSLELESQDDRFKPIFESWARRDFAAAEKAMRSAEHRHQRFAVAGLAEVQASRLPFEKALAWASDLEVFPEIAMSTVIDRLGKTDLESALRHLSEASISKHCHMANTLWGLERLSIEEAADLLERYPTRLPSLFGSLGSSSTRSSRGRSFARPPNETSGASRPPL